MMIEHRAELPVEPKPVEGLRPAKFAAAERCGEIMAAMRRYSDAGQLIPAEWIHELYSEFSKATSL
jgi:hypothetical protein